jgi:T5SS/PEP-CTERM-associated repeat protein
LNLNRRDQRSAERWLAVACALAFALLAVRHVDAAIVVDPLSEGATDVNFGFSIFNPFIPVTNPVPDPLTAPPNENLLVVGRTAQGRLRIDGGSLANVPHVWIGGDATGIGRVDVAGPGSRLATSGISVGSSGSGTLEISAGGLVEGEQIYIRSRADAPPNQLLISGAGSKLDLIHGLLVGGAGGSQVSTSNGAVVEALYVDVGFDSFSSGSAQATVDTNGKWFLSEFLELSMTSDGELTIGSGGEVHTPATYFGNAGAGPKLILAGGTLNAGDLYFGAGQIVGDGTIHAKGMVADVDLTFDAAHGPQQLVPIPGQPLAVLELDHEESGVLGAGYFSDATLSISQGRLIESSDGVLGYNHGSLGRADVMGIGSKWRVNGDLVVGRNGAGILRIGTGASVEVGAELKFGGTSAGEASHLLLEGGSLQVNVLVAAPSQLLGQGTIQAGGIHLDAAIKFDQPGVVGGSIVLDDLPNQQIVVEFEQSVMSVLGAGYKDAGVIEIRDGAKVQSTEGRLGQLLGSHGMAVVEGAGSEWKVVGGELRIGTYEHGRGSLQVLNGGLVEGDLVYITNDSSLEVGGSGAQFIAEQLRMHGYQEAVSPSLRVHSGGMARIDYLESNFYLPAEVEVEGAGSRLAIEQYARLDNAIIQVRDGGELLLSSGTDLVASGGVLHVDGGTVRAEGGEIDVRDSHLLLEAGALQGFRRINGDVLQTGGTLAVQGGQSTITGDLIQSGDSTLKVGYSGPPPAGWLKVEGLALISGTLEFEFVGGGDEGDIPLQLGDKRSLIYAARGLIGEFDEIVLPELPAGIVWSVERTLQDLSVELVAGDYNADGVVDAADYTTWRDTFGTQVTHGSGADGNRDGWVNEYDLYLWQEFFGRKVFSPSANIAGHAANSLAVPEPESVFVLLSGLLAAAAAYRRR